MRISEWSSALCSSDLRGSSRWTAWLGFPSGQSCVRTAAHCGDSAQFSAACQLARLEDAARTAARDPSHRLSLDSDRRGAARCCRNHAFYPANGGHRSEEHTSELQSLMRISYAVFCLKKK